MRNFYKRVFIGLTVLIIAGTTLLPLTGCKKQEKVIKIGAILPLTGPGSIQGNYCKESILLIKEIYSKKFKDLGYRLDIYIEDSKSSPKDAVFAYRKLTSEHPDILVFFTQMSSVANALAPITAKENKIQVSISSSLAPLKVNPNFFVDYIDPTTQANLYLDFLRNQKRLTLFYIDDEYGRSVKEAIVNKTGKKKITLVSFSSTSSARDIALKGFLKEGGIIIVGYGLIIPNIIKELRIKGFKGPIVCSPEILVPSSLELLKDYPENLFVIDFEKLPHQVSNFYHKKVEREPTIGDLLVYNGVGLILEAYIYGITHKLNCKDVTIFKKCIENPNLVSKTPSIKEIKHNILKYRVRIRPIFEER